jgi:hypothetical protein
MDVDEIRSREEEARRLRWLPYAVFAVISAALAIPILKAGGNWGVRDWDLFTTLHAAAVRSIAEYGQFPFWNPYIGGGNILFAHPEVPVLNPLFLLLLTFGPLTGLKIQMLVVYFIGFIGMYKLSRLLEISKFGSYIPPLVFMLSSYFALHFAAGHIPFQYFAALPWLLFFYKKALTKQVHILSAGGVVAFMLLGSGAAVPMLFSLFFLFIFSLFDIDAKRTYRPPGMAILIGICGLAFGAVKFMPMYDYLTRHPWIPEGTTQITPLWILPRMFLDFDQSLFANKIQGYVWGWHEYGAFIGPLALILAAMGLFYQFRRNWPYLALLVISIILAWGSFLPPVSPWDILHHLPGFESVRVPSRLILLGILALAILAGKGADVVAGFFEFRKVASIGALFLAIAVTHLYVCLPVLGEAFTREPEKVTPHKDFRQTVGDPNDMYAAFLANRGVIKAAWISGYRPGRGILSGNDRVAEWFSEDNRVQVVSRRFTPNRIGFEVRTLLHGRLVVSQGYDPGWHATDGREITPTSDLVSFAVQRSDRHVEIYYYPDYFTAGALISILSVLMALIGPPIYRFLRS